MVFTKSQAIGRFKDSTSTCGVLIQCLKLMPACQHFEIRANKYFQKIILNQPAWPTTISAKEHNFQFTIIILGPIKVRLRWFGSDLAKLQ